AHPTSADLNRAGLTPSAPRLRYGLGRPCLRRWFGLAWAKRTAPVVREDHTMTHDLIRRVETLGRPRILVVGDLILDRYVWGFAERISQEAPVPVLRADQREHRLGGAASVATMLRALDADVRLLGGVGNDFEATLVRGLLADQAIDDRWVVTLDERPTT